MKVKCYSINNYPYDTIQQAKKEWPLLNQLNPCIVCSPSIAGIRYDKEKDYKYLRAN